MSDAGLFARGSTVRCGDDARNTFWLMQYVTVPSCHQHCDNTQGRDITSSSAHQLQDGNVPKLGRADEQVARLVVSGVPLQQKAPTGKLPLK